MGQEQWPSNGVLVCSVAAGGVGWGGGVTPCLGGGGKARRNTVLNGGGGGVGWRPLAGRYGTAGTGADSRVPGAQQPKCVHQETEYAGNCGSRQFRVLICHMVL